MPIQELLTKRNALIAVLVIFALIFAANYVSLSSDSSYAVSGNTYAASGDKELAAATGFGSTIVEQQKLIITAILRLETMEFSETVERIRDVAFKFGGFVGESNLDLGERKTGFVTIKVPKERFEDAMDDIRNIATLKEEKSNFQDVTEEFVDLESRLKNLRASEARYLALLDKAETVSEILEVERVLSDVREQIERLEGRKKFLEEKIEFASIMVNVEEPAPQEKLLPDLDFQKPFQHAYTSFFASIFLIIELAGALIPIILVLALAWKLYAKFSGSKKRT